MPPHHIPTYYEQEPTNTTYFYTCAGCGKRRKKYIGEMYIKLPYDGAYYKNYHKYCCSELCFNFACFKYMGCFSGSKPVIYSKPEEYISF